MLARISKPWSKVRHVFQANCVGCPCADRSLVLLHGFPPCSPRLISCSRLLVVGLVPLLQLALGPFGLMLLKSSFSSLLLQLVALVLCFAFFQSFIAHGVNLALAIMCYFRCLMANWIALSPLGGLFWSRDFVKQSQSASQVGSDSVFGAIDCRFFSSSSHITEEVLPNIFQNGFNFHQRSCSTKEVIAGAVLLEARALPNRP